MAAYKDLLSIIESVNIKASELASGPLEELIEKMTAWVRINGDSIANWVGKVMRFIVDNADIIGKAALGFAAITGALMGLSAVLKAGAIISSLKNRHTIVESSSCGLNGPPPYRVWCGRWSAGNQHGEDCKIDAQRC